MVERTKKEGHILVNDQLLQRGKPTRQFSNEARANLMEQFRVPIAVQRDLLPGSRVKYPSLLPPCFFPPHSRPSL
jgi:hypothetical protein